MSERRREESEPREEPCEREDDFFREDDHDGWSPIERRRPPEPAPERS